MVFLNKLHTEKINSDFCSVVVQFSTKYLEVTKRAVLIKKIVVKKKQFY